MASAQALESLKILAGGPSYRRQRPTEDYGFSGAVPTQGELASPYEQEQAARAAAADTRDRAAFERTRATNEMVSEHNRPDVTAIRQEEENDALQKLLMPIRLKGQYAVEAAAQQAKAQAARDAALMGGRQDIAALNQGATTARASANAKSVGLRQRLQALQTGRAHAVAPSGISGWVPGAQGRADQEEITNLMNQIMGETNAPDEAPEQAGAASSGARMTRRLKSGGVAYSDDGGASWYQE